MANVKPNTFHLLKLKDGDYFCIQWSDLSASYMMLAQRWATFAAAIEDLSEEHEGRFVLEEFPTDFLAHCYFRKAVTGVKRE